MCQLPRAQNSSGECSSQQGQRGAPRVDWHVGSLALSWGGPSGGAVHGPQLPCPFCKGVPDPCGL